MIPPKKYTSIGDDKRPQMIVQNISPVEIAFKYEEQIKIASVPILEVFQYNTFFFYTSLKQHRNILFMGFH